MGGHPDGRRRTSDAGRRRSGPGSPRKLGSEFSTLRDVVVPASNGRPESRSGTRRSFVRRRTASKRGGAARLGVAESLRHHRDRRSQTRRCARGDEARVPSRLDSDQDRLPVGRYAGSANCAPLASTTSVPHDRIPVESRLLERRASSDPPQRVREPREERDWKRGFGQGRSGMDRDRVRAETTPR